MPESVNSAATYLRLMKSCLLVFLMFSVIHASGQNLVPNPSFERLSACPDNYFQIYKAPPWFSPDCGTQFPDHGYAVLFHGCNYSFAGVPTNNMCSQPAHSGTGYAGIEVFSTLGRHAPYRQYVGTPFTVPLEAGKKYYFSMYFNLCNRAPGLDLCFRPDSLGVIFTETKVDKNPSCGIVDYKPDLHAKLPDIIPGPSWYKIDGCYIAKGGEQFLMIGNYASEKFSNCGKVDTFAHFIYIDDVSMIQEIKKPVDTTLCPNTSWEMNVKDLREEYKTMEGWSFRWSDGEPSHTRKFDRATKLTLTASLENCFNDIYEFNVRVNADCNCQVFAPNIFTPNGDGLNDGFRPLLECKTIQVSNYSLTIFNRWGEKVFYSTNKTKFWDGKVKGNLHSSESYLWMVRYDMNRGTAVEHKSFSGNVTAVR